MFIYPNVFLIYTSITLTRMFIWYSFSMVLCSLEYGLKVILVHYGLSYYLVSSYFENGALRIMSASEFRFSVLCKLTRTENLWTFNMKMRRICVNQDSVSCFDQSGNLSLGRFWSLLRFLSGWHDFERLFYMIVINSKYSVGFYLVYCGCSKCY